MPEFTSYLPGTPSWVDLSTSEVTTAQAFYSSLFGWSVGDTGPDGGGYAMFLLRGKYVAGVGPHVAEGQPSAWTTYVSVEDADATTEKVRAAGGQVVVEPMDVLDVGRMAVLVDPTGAPFAIWQPRAHQGAQLADEPGAFCWNELQTRDTAAAEAFYTSVFGWEPRTSDMPGIAYTEWRQGEHTVGGMMTVPDEVPPQIPAYWLVYFAVEDCDVTVAKATELGGASLLEPTDIAPGRFAVLTDPAGAVFAVITMRMSAGAQR
ncbi:MAG: VOC family protein [Acidimicrobiales bacterium]